MDQIDILSIVESPTHPNYSAMYRELGLAELRVNSIRKAINLSKKHKPRFVIAEFFYAYSTNYSGVHKSNLDVLLVSLKKYSPDSRVIVMADKEDARYWQVLDALGFPPMARLIHPVAGDELRELLTGPVNTN